jgi:phosphoribosylaminoimidazole carboxylase PurE protein
MSAKPRVSIVMGSDSDLDIMREAAKALEEFGIEYEIDVTSAHRSPDRTAEYARKAAARGIRVIIAGAGGAAHLAGVIAAHTTLPVIGVPIPSTSLQGMDSLLATVQMPAGIPVATVAIGKPGATNAGILAAQILGLSSEPLARKLAEHKEKLANGVEEKSRKLKITLGAS